MEEKVGGEQRDCRLALDRLVASLWRLAYLLDPEEARRLDRRILTLTITTLQRPSPSPLPVPPKRAAYTTDDLNQLERAIQADIAQKLRWEFS